MEHRDELEEIYERWRLQTPGGLHSPRELWDEVLADREELRWGGSALFCLLHADGFVLYRVHGDEKDRIEIAKLAAVTPEAHIALWRVLLGMDLYKQVKTWTHPDDVLPYLLTDARLVRTTLVEDALWLRILDVPAVARGAHICGRFVCGAGHFGRCARWWRQIRARCARRQGALCAHRRRRRCAHRRCRCSAACTWVATAPRLSRPRTGCGATTPS